MLGSLSARGLLDRLLLLLLVVLVFLLGCYEMGDSDIWWHLRGGQWILENGRVPRLDPFTFGSADKLWVDIHWSYEVILALAYRVGGVGALVVLGATAGAGAFLAVLTARRREWPVAAVALCWLPVFTLLGFRLDPRPEIFSLLYLGCYLAILWRVEERPRFAWLLPVVQVLWVNVQGLFVLGPALLAMFLTAHGARLLWRRVQGPWTWTPAEKRWWMHVGGAAIAVGLACLVNPYFLQGAMFPFDLYPKVSDPNNPHKQYIDELKSPRSFVEDSTLRVAGTNWFFLALYFLLPLLPLSFLYPAMWRAWRAPRPMTKKSRTVPENLPAAPAAWLGALAGTIAVLLLGTLTLSGTGPAWLNTLGDNVSLLLLLSGGGAALWLRRYCPPAAALAGVGAAALAACLAWLDVKILGHGRGLLAGVTSVAQMAPPFLIAGAIAGGLVLRWGGSLFRILLAGAFAYLALQALQNWSRFALVAGAVLSWNFAEWAAEMLAAVPAGKGRLAAGWVLRAALALTLGVWIAALAGDRFYIHTGEPRHFAFREEPLAFAHDAAIFAGRPGLPDRALVYGLAQTGVYDFHNAPARKPFMDGRLEMPNLQTFLTYRDVEDWLRAGDRRWEKPIADMGHPLLLLEHTSNHDAEAHLLLHPDWRCVYFDALAAVFVPRQAGVSTEEFPAVDFAARHFRAPDAASVPDSKGAAAREEKALFNLSASLPRSPETVWQRRIPILLAALDRARLACTEDPERADVWVLRGNCHWNLNPQLHVRPPGPAEAWTVEQGIWWAQAMYCFRQALERQPDNAAAWRYLYQAFRARGMFDAQAAAGRQWLGSDPHISAKERQGIYELLKRAGNPRVSAPLTPAQLPSLVAQLLDQYRPALAAEVLDAAEAQSWTWSFAERVAGLYMHLGRPADARRVWEQARDCPSTGVRQSRLASTYWVEGDFATAVRHYQQARKSDPQLAEACWSLAMLHTQLGEADPALDCCRQGLRLSVNPRQRSDLEALERFLLPYDSRR
jgi:tetratricopeptide (TPR) repeat protein